MTRLTPAETLALSARLRAEAGEPEPARVPKAVRIKLDSAEEDIRVAMQIARERGFIETADMLLRVLRQVQGWTGRDGVLDYLGVER